MQKSCCKMNDFLLRSSDYQLCVYQLYFVVATLIKCGAVCKAKQNLMVVQTLS